MNMRPYEPSLEEIMTGLRYGLECLDLLIGDCAPELARLGLRLEERPTESELPESGLTRGIQALEVVVRAIQHLEGVAMNLEGLEAARAWDAAQVSEAAE